MKIIRIIIFLFLIFFINMPFSYAINMYLIPTNSQEENINTNLNTVESRENEINISEPEENDENEELSSRPNSVISSTSDISSNNELTISDIINIILIAVGIVLILLSVAILIRIR